jgi:hypothetical protein
MIGPPKIGSCLGPARRARVAAQALKGHRAGPALSTINRASGRARVVLFRTVPRAVNRARPIWNPIIGGQFFRSRLGLPLANELVGIFGIDVSGVGWASIMQWRQIKLRLSSRKLLLAKKLQSQRKKLIMHVSICHRSY